MTQAAHTSATPRSASRSQQGEAPVVIAQQLTKIFKDFWMRDRARAVDGITFEIRRGEIFGLLGPNGSGKSTTIKMVLGLLKKSSGRLAVFGKSPHDVSIKKRIGYLPEESYLYPFLNARETLDYYAKLFRLEYKVRQRRIDELLDMVGLSAVQHRQVREYSKGMQRRIGLAQALINDPEFLILDEPTTGLDPIGTRQVKDLIVTLGQRGKTILLSSHLLTDVEDVVDRMVILYGGKVRQAGTCDELLSRRTASIIETEALDEETIEEIRGVLARRSRQISRISAPRQKLEELFVEIVEQAKRDRLATSGAQHGGTTASFLRDGATPAATADKLIDQLVAQSEQAPVPMPSEQRPAGDADIPASDTRSGARSGADQPPAAGELIDALLSGEDGAGDAGREPEQDADAPRGSERPDRAGTGGDRDTGEDDRAQQRPPSDGPDLGVIGSLLDENDEGHGKGGKRDGRPGDGR